MKHLKLFESYVAEGMTRDSTLPSGSDAGMSPGFHDVFRMDITDMEGGDHAWTIINHQDNVQYPKIDKYGNPDWSNLRTRGWGYRDQSILHEIINDLIKNGRYGSNVKMYKIGEDLDKKDAERLRDMEIEVLQDMGVSIVSPGMLPGGSEPDLTRGRSGGGRRVMGSSPKVSLPSLSKIIAPGWAFYEDDNSKEFYLDRHYAKAYGYDKAFVYPEESLGSNADMIKIDGSKYYIEEAPFAKNSVRDKREWKKYWKKTVEPKLKASDPKYVSMFESYEFEDAINESKEVYIIAMEDSAGKSYVRPLFRNDDSAISRSYNAKTHELDPGKLKSFGLSYARKEGEKTKQDSLLWDVLEDIEKGLGNKGIKGKIKAYKISTDDYSEKEAKNLVNNLKKVFDDKNFMGLV